MLNMQQETENVVNWVREYVKNSGAKGVVIGNSGGKDSACVIAIATRAIGADNVLAVALPISSAQQDMQDAELVAKTFGVKMLSIDLNDSYNTMEKNIVKELNMELVNESKINMKPRLRMTALYSIAQTLGYLVIGTGNLCEGTVGYTTKWGDSAYDFNPIGNFTVEEVLQIGKNLGVPDKIINKPPNDGLGGLTDEEKLGVKYSQISEYILTGKTEEKAQEKIEKLYNASKHKRNTIPMYEPKCRGVL